MNILYIFNKPLIPSEGGVERVTDVIATELKRRGHRVFYLCYGGKDKIADPSISCPQYFISLDDQVNAVKQYQALLETLHISIIVSQLVNVQIAFFLSNTPKGIGKISVCHILPFASVDYIRQKYKLWRPTRLRGFLFKYLNLVCPIFAKSFYANEERRNITASIAVSDRLCFISSRFFDRVTRYIPDIDTSKLTAINNPNTFLAGSSMAGEKENTIIMVGRASNMQKNIPAFIRVWKKLSGRNPAWKALVIGDGPDNEANRRYAHSLGAERISFLGHQPDVAQFYKRAKFVVVTSFGESWCMVVTEAMAYGCVPCAFDTYESLHDIITDGTDGIIIPAFDEELMAERLQHYIDNDQQRAAMAQNGIRSVVRFAVENIADQWETLFYDIQKTAVQ